MEYNVPKPTKEEREVWYNLSTGLKAYLVKDLKLKIADFTCCDCPHVKTCRYSYDGYNTDGDCLELK